MDKEKFIENLKQRIAYIKKFKSEEKPDFTDDKDYNFRNDWRGIDSGECCDKCDISKFKKIGNMLALAGCKDPFQVKCNCHIPFRKVSAKVQLNLLEELLKSTLEEHT